MYSTACNLSKIFYDTASARRIADTIRYHVAAVAHGSVP